MNETPKPKEPTFLPCPFCYQSETIHQEVPNRADGGATNKHFVECNVCGARSRSFTDYIDGDPVTQIPKKVLESWNRRPRVAANKELSTLVDEIEQDTRTILEGKNKKTTTQTQKAAMNGILAKIESILPAARRSLEYVPVKVRPGAKTTDG